MVAKQIKISNNVLYRYLLAKIHMVAKPLFYKFMHYKSYLLAKIHMVAKHRGTAL